MKVFHRVRSRFSFIKRYHFRWALGIAVSWTVIDLIWIHFFHFSPQLNSDNPFRYISAKAIFIRAIIVFIMSSIMGYLLIFKLRQIFRDVSLLSNLILKTGVLLIASVIMNFLLHTTYSIFILKFSFLSALYNFYKDAISTIWLLHHSLGWIVLFFLTQLAIEFYEKYSPGVFGDILIGRYIQPKVQKRIVMFLDLVDSTPIAEKLDNKKYFSFIRDFIYYTSIALLEYGGRIYQYVGDEIVVTWLYNKGNKENCIKALRLSTALIKKQGTYFLKKYGYVPQFTVGIHAGEVTVGEIGIIKKDIAMSGDTMNTTARICDACRTLQRSCIVSKEFMEGTNGSWGAESLGAIDLKGKSENMELFALSV
jgi:adenylate cyclase